MILFKRICQLFLVSLVLSFSFVGCTKEEPEVEVDFSDPTSFSSAEAERDAIFSLGAYVAVYKDWQTVNSNPKRGHNIGSILVNEVGKPIAWDRNCIDQENDGTQHGEVRVMQQYIDEADIEVLDGYTVYTTLEPCIMCAGMMSMVKVDDCVYGQTDGDDLRTGYGRAVERINLDSTALENGYASYPRGLDTCVVSDLPYRVALDEAYAVAGEASITRFLLSDTAKAIYSQANDFFYGYEVEYDENSEIYAQTKALLETVN